MVIPVYGFISLQLFWVFYPFAFQAERVLSLPGSAHLSMRVFVRTITHPFFLSRVTKFAPDTHPGILSVGIENSGHWNWLSRSIWPVWILGNLVCLRNSFQWIWDTITTFAPNMDLGILSTGFENGGQCPGGGGGGGGGGILGQVSDRDAPHRPSTRNATRVKKGVETIHFAQFWWKIGVEVRHFPHFG